MSKRRYGVPGLFGETKHYDENGNYIGYSVKGVFGGLIHYDQYGNRVGVSNEGIITDYHHYDTDLNYRGASVPDLIGESHYDENGDLIGHSYPGIAGNCTDLNDDSDPFFDSMDTFDGF